MTATAPITPITGTATVAVPIDEAFRVFTGSIDSWWPHQFHIGRAEVAEVVLEPRENGRWYERGVDGTECDWGRVLRWEPPHRLLFTWQINGSWQFDPDPAHASEIDVRFTANGPAETTVVVEHSRFASWGAARSTTRSAAAAGGSCCWRRSPRPPRVGRDGRRGRDEPRP